MVNIVGDVPVFATLHPTPMYGLRGCFFTDEWCKKRSEELFLLIQHLLQPFDESKARASEEQAQDMYTELISAGCSSRRWFWKTPWLANSGLPPRPTAELMAMSKNLIESKFKFKLQYISIALPCYIHTIRWDFKSKSCHFAAE